MSQQLMTIDDRQEAEEIEAIPLKTITSLSGGKSSGYMWAHYPTDYCLFALVLTDDPKMAPKDKGLLREVCDRIPGFVGTAELEQTLANVLKLEQMVGKPITWVCAYEGQTSPTHVSDRGWLPKPLTFDRLIWEKRRLPNRDTRWCTEELKVTAIYWHIYLNILESPDEMVWMNIGYRYDESHRWEKLQKCKANRISIPIHCRANAATSAKKHRWGKEIEYRIPNCPMIEDRVDLLDVLKFWSAKGFTWPQVSNCGQCFYHDDHQLQHVDRVSPQHIDWASLKEKEVRGTWKKGRKMSDRVSAPQELLFPGGQFACICTD